MRSPINALIDLTQTDGLPTLPHSADTQSIWDTTIGWHPDDHQRYQLQQVYHAVLQGSRALNLTRITEPEDFWEKHLWDSMSGIRVFLNADDALNDDEISDDSASSDKRNQAANPSREAALSPGIGYASTHAPISLPIPLSDQPLNVIDIGTGAGFPGLPVAIACPAWHVTLLDSTQKKMVFLDTVIRALPLKNTVTVIKRVEAVGRLSNYRSQYDLALLRAVAPASVCAEYALPLLKPGGWAVLYRGHWTEADTEALLPVLEVLGGELDLVDSMQTPLTGGDRHSIILRKVAPTPEDFPRPVGIPAKTPL